MLILAIIWLLFAFPKGNQQAITIREAHHFFTVDELGQIYLVHGSELLKYKKTGERQARYSNLRFGEIASVDATNPLKILVYYRDYQQVIFLDNQLSVNGKVPLQDLGLSQAQLVCASANNSFWVYDQMHSELHRYDQSGKKTASTGNLRQLLNSEISPSSIIEQSNLLYLAAADAIYVFDIYGAFIRSLPLQKTGNLMVRNEVAYYQQEGKLCSYDLRTFSETCNSLPPDAVGARQGMGAIFVSYGDSLVVKLSSY